MHAIGVEMLKAHVFVCEIFCRPKAMVVDVVGPLGSWPTKLHECHQAQIVFVYNHRTNGVPLLLYAVLELDILSCGVVETNELFLVSWLRYDLLLGGAGGQHPCLAKHDVTTGVRLLDGFLHPIGSVN